MCEELDAEDRALLEDEEAMGHIRVAEEAHESAMRGEAVEWESVIREHIVR